jgi:phenylacetate-CoA ligase
MLHCSLRGLTLPSTLSTQSQLLRKPQSVPSWPLHVPQAVANLLVDCQWIEFYEREPTKTVALFQQQQISKVIHHAISHSPWWCERLRGIVGQRTPFNSLPLLDRQEYRASVESIGGSLPLPNGHGTAQKNSTSGSSGVPLTFYVSSLAGRIVNSHYFFDEKRQGRDRSALRVELMGRVPAHDGDHIEIAGNALLGQGLLLKRKVQQASIKEHARWLARVEPAYVCTPPSLLDGLLDEYEAGEIAPPRIKQIASSAETVTQELRDRAQAILGASIRDRYSCEEVGPIAFQCPHNDTHYHVARTNCLVEILDEAGQPCAPGVIGRVLVTNLHNYASPAIRYEIGDLAAWEPFCPCGYKGAALTRLLGRKRFLIRLPSGERTAVRFGAKEWLGIAPFRETRLVQVSEGILNAELVLDRPMTTDEKDAVLAMLRSEISPHLTYEIKEMDRINWGPTYKRQDVVSLI